MKEAYGSVPLHKDSCEVSVAIKLPPNFMLMIWSLLCTKKVKKINESFNIYLEETEYNPNSILRRDPSNSTVSKIKHSGERHIVAASRCFVKHRKICPRTRSENGIFAGSYRLKRNVSFSSGKESNENRRHTFLFSDQVPVKKISQLVRKLCFLA